jgi:uncharacterized protein DUF6516
VAGSVADVRARLLYGNRKRLASGAIVDEVIWKLPQPEPGRPHGYKYRLAYVRDGRRLIGYDNERGKGDHRHYSEHEEEYRRATIQAGAITVTVPFEPNNLSSSEWTPL